MDVDTTIEFVLGGGTILPGLDDNFLADRTIYFPMVSSDKAQKATIGVEVLAKYGVYDRSIWLSLILSKESSRSDNTGTRVLC